MKQNGNDKRTADYYIGLDVGSDSVGWAVTDTDYRVLRFHGKHMWGVRLFPEAQGAAERRTSRAARRRLQRRKQRLTILELLFAEEITKVDPQFFIRLHESDLWQEDKKSGSPYSLFNEPGYSDKEYHIEYPTIYHLRSELVNGTEPHDVRLVFLALHHLMKYRGHFLHSGDGSEEVQTAAQLLQRLFATVRDDFDQDIAPLDEAAFESALLNAELRISEKKGALRAAMGKHSPEDPPISPEFLCDLLAGAKVSLNKLFPDAKIPDELPSSLSLKEDLDEHADKLLDALEERAELLFAAKDVFDAARLSAILGEHLYICDAKVALYEKNASDLRLLKKLVKEKLPVQYKRIFTQRKSGLNNYPAYSRYKAASGAYICSQEEFCKFLEGELKSLRAEDEETERIFREIQESTFLTKLRGTENGLIPYQLQKRELCAILRNAAQYLPFLNAQDEDGNSCSEKIIKTFEFRVPYYVGPLNRNSPRNWHVRFPGKEHTQVMPWNFREVVDTEASAMGFIENLIGACQYTGEPVLPKDSLLYGEYMLRNELNPLRINGKPLEHKAREQMIQDLFVSSKRPVTKKTLREYLLSRGLIQKTDEITGIDDRIKTVLKSRHDMARLLEKTGNMALVEQVIRSILVFGEDKKMLGRWLRRNVPDLDEADIRYLSRLKYSDWGNLSAYFLTQIYSEPDETGEIKSIMDMLRETNLNLMQLLSKEYSFAQKAEEHRDELLGNRKSLSDRLDALYAAPAVRRAIRQAMGIVDEIVDIRRAAPKKIFIEMARGNKKDVQKKRTESRKEKLTALYAKCQEEAGELAAQLELEDDNRLRSDKLYLYYIQMGKCMYSGEPIDLEDLMQGKNFDRDHIFPRSKVKDDSLDNLVLVKNTLNREKTNEYPIKQEIREKMAATWAWMRKNELIREKKYERLIRGTPLTEQELSAFVARQLTQTRQSTRALATVLGQTYGKTRIVYSKAGNMVEFRQKFKFVKYRELNDLHHAKDAYLNIVVGNVYDTRFTEQFFRNILREEYSVNVDAIFEHDTPGAWLTGKTIITVKDMMRRNDPIVTRMPQEVRGALFDLLLMPAGKGQLEKRRGLDKERYGGYNKLTGSFYCVVEHSVKGKRIRTIEPVFLYCAESFKNAPVTYLQDVLGLQEPRIIVRCIRNDALLELDGKRLYPSGRTGDRIVMEHAYQLSVSPQQEKLLKDIAKYVERCAARRMELPLNEHDGLSKTTMMELYSCFMEKCDTLVYRGFFGAMLSHLKNSQEKFEDMSILSQAKTLLEIMKAFQSNALNPNLKELCGKGLVGRITYSNKLTGFTSAYLINQSITGLYEYKVNLLTEQ